LAADDAAADLDVAMAGDKRKTVTKQLISDATTLLDSSIKDLQLAEQQLIILREQHEEMLEHEISLERLKADDSDRLELITLQLNALRERNKESAAEIGHLVANAEAERQRADAQSEMDDSKEIEKRGVAIGKEAVAAQQLAMSMMAAGSAMMMFSGATKDAEAREKRMRVAMILMNAAMIPQIFGMMKLTKQMGIGISVETIMERARHRIAVATGQATAANQAYSISLNSIVVGALSAEGAVSKLSGAFYRAIAPLAAFIAVGYGLTFLMEKLGFFGDTEQFAQTGTSSIQDTADAFKDNTKSITQLANEIVEYENEIDRISGLEGAQYEDRKQQLLDLISLNERLIGVVGSETADALGFEAAAEELFALQTELDDITGTFGKFNEETGRFAMIGGEGFMDSAGFALNRIVLGSTGAMGEAADEAAVLTQQINDLLASNEDFANFIESEGIDNIDEFVEALLQNDKALDNLQKTINGSEGSMGGFNSEIENSIQLFDEFNNAREELFFGFKAGNITGDLVKQIEQKGVENFVANTEIIMTNNFNGMTTDQVADEILRKINERAVTNGINVSPA
jgi:hypothetical protein